MTESKLVAHDKAVVTPGEVIAEGMEYFPGVGTYRHEDKILANQLGLLNIEGKVLKTTPLAGRYLPARNDIVIGRVIDILMSGWRIDINCPYSSVLPLKDATFDFIKKGADLTEYFALEDYVVCKITQVTSQNLIDVSMKGPGLRKLRGGQFMTVNAAKVPRIIGRKGSMVSMIKKATGCQIAVGQNGLVWISGEPAMEIIATRAIQQIEREAHVPGLTERIKSVLEKETGTTLDIDAITREAEAEAAAAEAGSRGFMRPPREESFHDRRDDGDGDRPPRREYGGDDRGPRREFGDGPRRDGDRPPRRDFGRGRDGDRGPRRDFGGDRGPRRDGPRRDGPRPEGPRPDAPRQEGASDAPQGESSGHDNAHRDDDE